jgi:mRNA interferase MazF
MADFDPVRGHEQAGRRPALIVSDDAFNSGPAELIIVVPFTSKTKGASTHFAVNPPEGGLTMRSYAKCEDIRSVSKERLRTLMGEVTEDTMEEIRYRLRRLLVL